MKCVEVSIKNLRFQFFRCHKCIPSVNSLHHNLQGAYKIDLKMFINGSHVCWP